MSAHAPEWLTEEYVQQLLCAAFKKNTLNLKSFDVSPGCAPGENYTGVILRLNLKFTEDAQEQQLFMIAKFFQPSNEPTLEVRRTLDFETEVQLLSDIIPRMTDIVKQTIAPKLYHADPKHRAVFLEDLKTHQFQMAERNPALDLEHSLVVMETLARFHAAGIQLLKKQPELEGNFEVNSFSTYWQQEAMCITEGLDAFLKALPAWPLSEELKLKLQRLNETILDKAKEVTKRNPQDLNSIIHSDCWINNMMFRYKDGKALDAMLIDFQGCSYHSVAFELAYFIFSSTNVDVKTQHIPRLLHHYHQTLTKLAGQVITLKELYLQFEKRFYFAVVAIMSFLPFIIKPDTQRVEMGPEGQTTKLGQEGQKVKITNLSQEDQKGQITKLGQPGQNSQITNLGQEDQKGQITNVGQEGQNVDLNLEGVNENSTFSYRPLVVHVLQLLQFVEHKHLLD